MSMPTLIKSKPSSSAAEDEAVLNKMRALDTLESMGHKRLQKAEVLAKVNLSEIALMAYDWRITYGVRVLPKAAKGIKQNSTLGAGRRWLDFKAMCGDLNARRLSGSRASESIRLFLQGCSELEDKWYRRILLRDLRVGLATKSFNTAYGDIIPTWGVQLADTVDREGLQALDYSRLWADVKIDGIRLTVVVFGGRGIALARSGHEYPQLTHIVDACVKMGSGLYDGEVYASQWNDTSSLMRSDPNSPGVSARLLSLKFHWFDFVPLRRSEANDVVTGKASYDSRRYMIAAKIAKYGLPDAFRAVPSTLVRSPEHAYGLYMKALSDGFEGLMLKRGDGVWSTGRTADFLKFKPFKTVEGEVTGTVEGRGRNEGRLGALVVSYQGNTIQVGGGFTDADRSEFWSQRKSLIGKVVEFKVQDDSSAVAVARFNVFKRFRFDRSAESEDL